MGATRSDDHPTLETRRTAVSGVTIKIKLTVIIYVNNITNCLCCASYLRLKDAALEVSVTKVDEPRNGDGYKMRQISILVGSHHHMPSQTPTL